MTKGIKVTVIAAFYNDVELLRLLLDALEAKKTEQLEVIIADDGSSEESVNQVNLLKENYSFPVMHLWQPDAGFNKTIILNKAVVRASGDVLIFIDADCIPQGSFINDHLKCSNSNVCLVGRRVNVFRDAVKTLNCREPDKIIANNFLTLFWWSLTGRTNHLERGIRLPSLLNAFLKKESWGIVGCNFSLQRRDLLAINGFDERHGVQWGAEDSDLQRRLQLYGVKLKSLAQQACQIHFDTAFFKRKNKGHDAAAPEQDYLKLAARENQYFTPYGIVKGASMASRSPETEPNGSERS